MVIYGHDKEANDALFAWLRAIGLQAGEWSQLIRASGSASPFIGEVLDKALRDVQAVVAFFTPDEYVTTAGAGHGRGRLQALPNVLIEAGMALITHPTRTIIAVLGDQELPSDLAGRHYVRLSHTDVQPLNDLAGRLGDAGCDIDLSGSDWLNPGRFPIATAPSRPPGNIRPVWPARRELRPDRPVRTGPTMTTPRIYPQHRLPARSRPANHTTRPRKPGSTRRPSVPSKTPTPARCS